MARCLFTAWRSNVWLKAWLSAGSSVNAPRFTKIVSVCLTQCLFCIASIWITSRKKRAKPKARRSLSMTKLVPRKSVAVVSVALTLILPSASLLIRPFVRAVVIVVCSLTVWLCSLSRLNMVVSARLTSPCVTRTIPV